MNTTTSDQEAPVYINKLQQLAEKAHSDEISSIYPNTDNKPERLDFKDDDQISERKEITEQK